MPHLESYIFKPFRLRTASAAVLGVWFKVNKSSKATCAVAIILLSCGYCDVGATGIVDQPLIAEEPVPVYLGQYQTPFMNVPLLPKDCVLESVVNQDGYTFWYGAPGTGKVGFCNMEGHVLIQPDFEQIRYIGESRLVGYVRRLNAEPFYVLFDIKGHKIAKLPTWVKYPVNMYADGVAIFGSSIEAALIDTSGKVIVKPGNFQEIQSFNAGLAAVTFSRSGRRYGGFIDTHGRLVLGPFDNAYGFQFQGDYAIIRQPLEGDFPHRDALIRRDGKCIVPFEYNELSITNQNLLIARKEGQYYLLRLDNGDIVAKFPPSVTLVSGAISANTPLIACKFGGRRPGFDDRDEGKWGYCDLTGAVAIQPKFDRAENFDGEKADVCVTDKNKNVCCGIIDRKGNWLVKPDLSGTNTNAYNLGNVWQIDFEKMLFEHNLIGMGQDEWMALLGKPKNVRTKLGLVPIGVDKIERYSLLMLNSVVETMLEIGVDANGKIVCWQTGEQNGQITWVTDDAVMLSDGILVPKSQLADLKIEMPKTVPFVH